jgi:Zn/Cd-binding protein ZinT
LKRNKAEKRKHKFRMRNNLLKKVKNDNTLYPYLNDKELKKYINKWADIQCMCSCSMCCNPRHDKWRSKEQRLTIQERKVLLYYKNELKELNVA